MNILLTMSISGSIVFLLYLLTRPVLNRYLTARWQYVFLKICVLFFLIPYQCLQNKYLILYNLLFGTGEAINPLREGIHTFKATDTIFISGDGQMHYRYWQPFLIFTIIWLCFVIILLFRQIRKYRFCRKALLFLSETSDAETINAAAHYYHTILPKQKKSPQIIECSLIKSPFTIGLFHPIVVLPKLNNTEDSPLYLMHELYHIRNHDILWKCIAFLAILIHWYNPLIYLLFYEICTASEKHCDELVSNTLDEAQKEYYEHLIIDAAQNQTNISILFADTFSTNKKQVKERLLFMTRKQSKPIFQKIIIAVVICLAAFSMPISVSAYQPIYVYRDNHYDPAKDAVYITFDDSPSPLDVAEDHFDFSLSDNILTDEYGNQYILAAESEQVTQSCTHEYISGIRREHAQSGSDCTVDVYQSTYCKKCGNCLQESPYSQTSYISCPH